AGASLIRRTGKGIPKSQLMPFTRRLVWAVSLLLALAGTVAGCHKTNSASRIEQASPVQPELQEAPPWFRDITDEVGLNFIHNAGPVGRYFMPQSMGSGAALFDFDNNGRLDIYLLQNGGPNSDSTNRLFHQGADGRFTDVSAGSGLDIAGYGMGVAIGDVNND